MQMVPPPPRRQPAQPQQPAQPINQNVPNVVGMRGFFYPRWWVLSAFLMSTIFLLIFCFGRFFPCSSAGYLCSFTTWHPVYQVAAIWLVFLLVAGLAFFLGLGSIEIPGRDHSPIALFFRNLSEFGPLSLLLQLYALIALGVLIAMWLLDRSTPFSFAYLAIAVFVGNTSFFHRHTLRERRSYLIGYGIVGLISLPITALYRSAHQALWPFLLAGLLLMVSGIAASFWRPRPVRQLTAQEQVDANIARAATPGFLLRNTWPLNRFLPNRPNQVN